jgi:hypothetical protein
MKKPMIITIVTLIITSCAWVNENEAGKAVLLTTADQISNCQKMGDISANVKYKVGFILRGEETVQRELRILARNEAVKLGGNRIVADDRPIEGKQNFQAYLCP